MPATFEKLGISFQYPENWKLDEQDILEGRNAVTIYSPGGGFWSVALDLGDSDAAQLAKAAVDAMRQEYQDIEVEETRETVADHEVVGYDLNFFYLDLTNTAGIRSFRIDQTTYTVFYQAEDREYEEIHRVFQAMTFSLIQSLRPVADED